MKFIITAALVAFILSACAGVDHSKISNAVPASCNIPEKAGAKIYRGAAKVSKGGISEQAFLERVRKGVLKRRLIAPALFEPVVGTIFDAAYSGKPLHQAIVEAERACLNTLDAEQQKHEANQ